MATRSRSVAVRGQDEAVTRTTDRQRAVVLVGVLLLTIAVVVAAQPLDSGDNFCGNAFVSRGDRHEFNGCDSRLTKQRLGSAAVAVVGVGCVLVVARGQ